MIPAPMVFYAGFCPLLLLFCTVSAPFSDISHRFAHPERSPSLLVLPGFRAESVRKGENRFDQKVTEMSETVIPGLGLFLRGFGLFPDSFMLRH